MIRFDRNNGIAEIWDDTSEECSWVFTFDLETKTFRVWENSEHRILFDRGPDLVAETLDEVLEFVEGLS